MQEHVDRSAYLKALQVWPLLVHHLGQKLVLQSVSSNCKIDEGSLGLNLWLIMRIGQFSVEDKSEARVEQTLFVPNFDTTVTQ